MDSENIARRKTELNKIKKGLKEWEYGFFKTHKRKPTIVDIQERSKVERVYKDYQTKKKQLQQLLSGEYAESQTLSQPISFDSQQHGTVSQENKADSASSSSKSPSQKRRRGSQASVEYIRSPTHRLSRIKYLDQLTLPTTSLDFGSSSKSKASSSQPTPTRSRSTATDADSFWLSGSKSSSSSHTQPSSSADTLTQENGNSLLDSGNTPSSSFLLADNNNSGIIHGTSNKKKKKKNAALQQKLFGHLIWKPSDTLSPALKAERESSSQPTTPTTEKDSSSQPTTPKTDTGMSLDSPTLATTSMEDIGENGNIEMITDDITTTTTTTTATTSATTGNMVGDLKIDGLIIAEHERDLFGHIDPDLAMNLEDPDYFVMPGHFANARARSTMMEEDNGRHNRILEALQQGTLGEKRRDDNDMGDMDDGLKRFLEENTDSFAESIDMDGQEELQRPTYRKKFTQKRQTRLHKFKYVETTPSNV